MMKSHLASFVKRYHNPQKALLLGLSGGPDSLALLYLLCDYSRQNPLRLHVAHVDHGWRAGSADEALALEALVNELGLPFHRVRLSDDDRQGNLEAAGRCARMRFFTDLCERHDCQAVMLGHQADDVAETTLKRLLEGVTLPYLNGLQPMVKMDGLEIWRPLLGVPKAEILTWLKARGVHPFEDCTNQDPRFLRGKMRTRILPWLAEQFGKEVHHGLVGIADEASALREYLDERVAPHLVGLQEGPLGFCLDISKEGSIPIYELYYLVRKVVERAGFFLSRKALKQVASNLQDRSAHKRVVMGAQELVVDRRRLFVLRNAASIPDEPIALAPGKTSWGPWQVTVQSEPFFGNEQRGWRNAWRGMCACSLPPGHYMVGRPDPHARLSLTDRDTTLGRWWSHHKVPAFLRALVPVVWQGDKVCVEFLSGKAITLPVSALGIYVQFARKLTVEAE